MLCSIFFFRQIIPVYLFNHRLSTFDLEKNLKKKTEKKLKILLDTGKISKDILDLSKVITFFLKQKKKKVGFLYFKQMSVYF